VGGAIAPRSPLSWLAILFRLCAAALACVALLTQGSSPRWILLMCAAGFVIVPVAWRRKAAVAPAAILTTSADYLPREPGHAQFPGELSVTASALTWNPSRHSAANGILPLAIAIEDCTGITMQAGPALLDVIVTVHPRSGGEWLFLTHRSPRLRRAIARLDELATG
jgi:hypothetical protein